MERENLVGKIESVIRKLKERPFVIILSFILLVEVAYLIRFNFVHAHSAIDQDAAKLMTHTIEIVRNKKLLIPEWRYMTTHEIDSAMLLAIPMYAITHDIVVAFAISNSVFIIVLLMVIIALFRNADIKIEYALVSCCVIFTPYDFGMLDYMNMLFIRGAQYSIKILIPLLGIVIFSEEGKWTRQKCLVIPSIWLFLVFLCGFSSGLLAFVTCIIPLAGVYCLHLIEMRDTGASYIRRSKTIFLLASIIFSIFGFKLQQYFGISQRGVDSNIVYLESFADRINNNLTYFLYLLKALPSNAEPFADVSIVSFDGIGYLCRFVLSVILLFVCAYFTSVFIRRKKIGDSQLSHTIDYLVVISCVNIFIHLVSSYSTPRYYLVETICMMLMMAFYISQLSEKFRSNVVMLLVVIAISVLWVTSRRYIATCLITEDTYWYCEDICDVIVEHNVDNVIVINNTKVDEICRFLLPDQKISNYSIDDKAFISWDYYKSVNDKSFYGDSSIIVAETGCDIASVFGEEVASTYKFIEEVNGFNLYKSDKMVIKF